MAASILSTHAVHEGWCRLLIAKVRSDTGQEFQREIEDHGNAVAVLPYDPVRSTLMLVRLARFPVVFAGGEGLLLEAPAGMIDEGTAEETARREAMEETGLRLGSLDHVCRAWTSPGISTEAMDLYLAPYSEADRIGKGGGIAGENENIEVVELAIRDADTKVKEGSIKDLKTLFLILALKDRHPELFDGA